MLKLLDILGDGGRYYYICPGQALEDMALQDDKGRCSKFTSSNHNTAYVYIKILKTALKLDDVNMFLVKRELRKENFANVITDGM